MPIKFKRLLGFEGASGNSRHLVLKCFLGKEFDSLNEALSQKYEGHDLRWHGFGILEEKIIPTELPYTVKQATIYVRESEERGRVNEIPIVKAVYQEQS